MSDYKVAPKTRYSTPDLPTVEAPAAVEQARGNQAEASGAQPYRVTRPEDVERGPQPYKVAEAWEVGAGEEKAEALPPFLAQADEEDKRSALDQARPESRKVWHDEVAEEASLLARPMSEEYLGEETGQEAPGHLPTTLGPNDVTGTHYANDALEYGTQIGGGLSQHGETLNSADKPDLGNKESVRNQMGVKRMYAKDKHERLNFAMDAAGGFYTSDPMAESRKRVDREDKTAERINHSSMLGGMDAAAAGTVKVRDGQVEDLSDSSGHYKPNAVQTNQAVGALVDSGAMDEMRSSVTLGKKDRDEKDLQMSTLEFMAYGEDMKKAEEDSAMFGDQYLSKPEEKIRASHKKKDAVLGQLAGLGADPTQSLHSPVEGPQLSVEEKRKRRGAEHARLNPPPPPPVVEAKAPEAKEGEEVEEKVYSQYLTDDPYAQDEEDNRYKYAESNDLVYRPDD